MFFLMCSERSGSNLISKVMNGHSNVCGPFTKHVINPVARNFFRYEPHQDDGNWSLLIKDIHRLMSADFSEWKRSFSIEDLYNLSPERNIAGLLRNIFMEEARCHGKQHVFIKENHLYEFLPFLMAHFPEAKYVYQSRDPRDMALSWKKSPVHGGGVIAGAKQWKKDQQGFLKDIYLMQQRKKGIMIRYEDLITRPNSLARKLCGFLDVTYEPAMAEAGSDAGTRNNAAKQVAWENLEKPIIHDNHNKYRSELSSLEISAVEKICWFEMNHLGYTTTYSEKDLSSLREEEIIRLEERERKELPPVLNDGVRSNIDAKRYFYQR